MPRSIEDMIKQLAHDAVAETVDEAITNYDFTDDVEDAIDSDTVQYAVDDYLSMNFDISDHVDDIVKSDDLIDKLLDNLTPAHARKIIQIACQDDSKS